MLSNFEKRIWAHLILNQEHETCYILIAKKAFEDYNVTVFNGKDYKQLGKNLSKNFTPELIEELKQRDEKELIKTVYGIYLSLIQSLQQKNLNE